MEGGRDDDFGDLGVGNQMKRTREGDGVPATTLDNNGGGVASRRRTAARTLGRAAWPPHVNR